MSINLIDWKLTQKFQSYRHWVVFNSSPTQSKPIDVNSHDQDRFNGLWTGLSLIQLITFATWIRISMSHSPSPKSVQECNFPCQVQQCSLAQGETVFICLKMWALPSNACFESGWDPWLLSTSISSLWLENLWPSRCSWIAAHAIPNHWPCCWLHPGGLP